ncbi:Imm31 family immunity protein [Microbulbifer sp. TYP-18]|uniref:Imm31 family immunity protein n=1 Tax=Microbulbifer sp. TYP-18 TaxID=3230024 RepID=UPI0034C6823B
MMLALYDFYDVVLVKTDREALSEINGKKGAILGRAENDQGEWSYSVHIFESEECWDVMEAELESTGTAMAREDFYDGDSVIIEVDSKTGEGKLKNS